MTVRNKANGGTNEKRVPSTGPKLIAMSERERAATENSDPDDLLSFKEARRFLNCGRNALLNMMFRRNGLPYVQFKPHGRIRFRRRDLDRWIEQHTRRY